MSESFLEEVKKLYEKIANQNVTSDLETTFSQMENNLSAKDGMLEKMVIDLDQANSKISELTEELENINKENDELSEEYSKIKAELDLLENDNRKCFKKFEENLDNDQAFSSENELIRESIDKHQREKQELQKSLKELNRQFEENSAYIDALNIEENLTKNNLDLVKESLLDAENIVQRTLINPEHYDGLKKDVRSMIIHNESKLKKVEAEKGAIQKQLTELKVKCSVLKNQLTSDESFSDYLELFIRESKRNSAYFLATIERQNNIKQLLEKRLKAEESIGKKLKLWLGKSEEKVTKFQEIDEKKHIASASVENEAVSMDVDDFLIDLTQILQENVSRLTDH